MSDSDGYYNVLADKQMLLAKGMVLMMDDVLCFNYLKNVTHRDISTGLCQSLLQLHWIDLGKVSRYIWLNAKCFTIFFNFYKCIGG